MFAAGKPVWYLPLAVTFSAALLFALVLGYDRYIFAHSRDHYLESFTSFLSADTIAALREDARLHHAILGLTETIAQTSSDIGQRYGIGSMRNFGTTLTESISELRKRDDGIHQKRGMLEDMNQAMGRVLGLNTTGGLSCFIGNLSAAFTEGLATPALFLGIGNVGTGIAGQIAPALGAMDTSLGPAAFAFAAGIGNSTAKALNLTSQVFLPSTDSGFQAVAGNLGLGLSTPIVSNIDFQAVMRSAVDSGLGASLLQQLPQIAAAAGNGLGEGAKNGLRLGSSQAQPMSLVQKRQSTNPLQGIDVPGTVTQFTKGLGQSLLTGVDITNLASKLNLTGSLGSMVDPSMFPAVASGAGSGIGMGLAIGLQFKPPNAPSLIAQSGNASRDDMQAATIAETFTQNLVSNFLFNSTILKSFGSMISNSTPQILKDADAAKTAEGFARGAIEGISTALSSVGGLQNLLSGDFSDNALMNVPVLSATKFNDSINGSAVSFARGFMGEGTILIGDILRKMNRNANTTGSALASRDVAVSPEEAAIVPYNALSVRQAPDNNSPMSSLPRAINEATLMMGGQLAIDKLTCQGIGGLASAVLGAMNASKNNKNAVNATSIPLDPQVLGSLPQGPVEFTSEGNTFRIVLKDATISVNGLALIPFGILTALHVLFIMLAFLLTLPLYLILGVVWRLSILAGHPVNEVKNKKWRLGLLITFGISAVTGITLGIVGMGNSRHFRDPHGIFGLVALILVFPTVGLTIARLRSEALYPLSAAFVGLKAPFALLKSPDQKIYIISGIFVQLSFAVGQLTFINGFSTLRSISLCVVDAVLTSNTVAGLMGLLLMVQVTAAGMVGIRTWLEQHIAKRERAGVQRTTIIEAGGMTQKESTATFGFGGTRSKAPPPLNLERPAFTQRNTEDLQGFADGTISTPFNVRNEGVTESKDFENPRQLTRQPSGRNNPFLSPAEQRDLEERVYPKTAEYQYTYASAIDDATDYYNVPAGYQPRPEVSSGRPSSELIDPLRSPLPPGLRAAQNGYPDPPRVYGSPPKTEGVTLADLFPPPPPPPMDAQMQLTAKSVTSSYSRPFNEGRRPSSDAFRGYGSGPGDTVRTRRYS
ncbi:hypothetical protein C7974DRAFT_359048 [Boeremia exigua]|uniref:uncharacterized protein n=1 Tax=Boeremia exigua TaxID=749465 RepID=UPI001E8D0C5F|nr:uncharacterized protein C7974DRAFT_359048 [Boeremia exigua]KAH6629333.1 hypothetical protein C7974DRAFT_359048 [Boeremia exigua]